MDNNIAREASEKKEDILKQLRTSQFLTEEEMAILFLSSIFEEESNEKK